MHHCIKKKKTFGLLKLFGAPKEVSSEGRLLRCPLPSPASPAPSPEAGAALRPSGSDCNINMVKKISIRLVSLCITAGHLTLWYKFYFISSLFKQSNKIIFQEKNSQKHLGLVIRITGQRC